MSWHFIFVYFVLVKPWLAGLLVFLVILMTLGESANDISWLSTVSKLYHLANPLFPCFLLNFTFTVEVNALNAYLKFKRKNVPTITNIMAVWLSPFNDCQFDFPIYVDLGLIISAVFLFCENLIEKKNRNDFKLGKD